MSSYFHIISMTNALIAWTAVYLIFMRPRLATDRDAHLKALIAPHLFRYLGLVALMDPLFPVRSLGFGETYLAIVAWGDYVTGLLALAAIVAVHAKARFAIPLVWTFNVVGFLDFANAGIQMTWPLTANPTAVGPLGWVILTVYLPMLIVSHVAIFRILIAEHREAARSGMAVEPAR